MEFFLLFVSLFVIFDAVERLFEPPPHSAQTQSLILVAILGLVVNVVGILFFHEHLQTRSEIRHAREENIYVIAVHMFLDCIGSIGVIVAAWLSSLGWVMADPIVAIAITFLIIYNAIPICKRTAKVLLQTAPTSFKDQLDKALREACTLEGVLEYRNEHFWTQSPGVFVGSLYVRVRSDANEQVVLSRVRSLFTPLISHLTVQVEKDDFNTLFSSTVHN